MPIEGSGAYFPDFMKLSILDPCTYYNRRVNTDAFRAVKTEKYHPSVGGVRLRLPVQAGKKASL